MSLGDGFPPPGYNITEGTTEIRDQSSSYSAIYPYGYEAHIFRKEEFKRIPNVTLDDFFICTSVVDGDTRYIRKIFVESICRHNQGTIIRTYSGDFHLVAEPISVFPDRLPRTAAGHEHTERELLKTTLREIQERLDLLEKMNPDKEADNAR